MLKYSSPHLSLSKLGDYFWNESSLKKYERKCGSLSFFEFNTEALLVLYFYNVFILLFFFKITVIQIKTCSEILTWWFSPWAGHYPLQSQQDPQVYINSRMAFREVNHLFSTWNGKIRSNLAYIATKMLRCWIKNSPASPVRQLLMRW